MSTRAGGKSRHLWSLRRRAYLVVAAICAAELTGGAAACAQTLANTLPLAGTAYRPPIAEAAQRFAIPAAWITAIMRTESAGNPRAVSRVGAMGLMQIMPATWRDLSARYDLGSDPFDPRANILAGAAYLRAMLDRYGELARALAAYNAGPGRVDSWLSSGLPLPAETRAYVARIVPLAGREDAGPRMAMPPSWQQSGLFAAPGPARPLPETGAETAAALPPANLPSSRFSGPVRNDLFARIGEATAP